MIINPENIMIVEDEGIVAKDIEMTLKRLGYKVSAIVSSGEEAIRKTVEALPDLVLMDIVLEGDIDGIETARHIGSHFDVPIVYLTAYIDEETLLRAMSTSPFGYIVKPFDDRQLYSSIQMAYQTYKAVKNLKDRELSLWSVFENTSEMIMILDMDNEIRLVNRSLEKELGYKPGELSGSNIQRFFHPDDHQTVLNSLKKAGKNPDMPICIECCIRHADGSWHDLKASFLNNPGIGGIIKFLHRSKKHCKHLAESEGTAATLQETSEGKEQLQGVLPICSLCKSIRDKNGKWHQIENYIMDHAGVEFIHGYCPDCFKKLYSRDLLEE